MTKSEHFDAKYWQVMLLWLKTMMLSSIWIIILTIKRHVVHWNNILCVLCQVCALYMCCSSTPVLMREPCFPCWERQAFSSEKTEYIRETHRELLALIMSLVSLHADLPITVNVCVETIISQSAPHTPCLLRGEVFTNKIICWQITTSTGPAALCSRFCSRFGCCQSCQSHSNLPYGQSLTSQELLWQLTWYQWFADCWF